LFDFESGGPNELSFVAGEVLTVTEQVGTHLCNIIFIVSGSVNSCIVKLFPLIVLASRLGLDRYQNLPIPPIPIL